ncbi:MAG: metalloregulator ArsR/SmtB family transcription factor [Waddliaceae bacterium]
MMPPSEFFSLLSDETRLRCLVLLLKEKELCVCELGEVIRSHQPKISRHLALLRKSGIVTDKRRGQWVYYRINPDLRIWVMNTLKAVFKELKDGEPFHSDLERLQLVRQKQLCKTGK